MKPREIVKDTFANMAAFLIFFTILASAHLVIFNTIPWIYLILIVPFYMLYWVRKNVFIMKTFFIIHILFLAFPFILIYTIGQFVPMMAVTLLCIYYSVQMRNSGEWRPQNGHIVMLVVLFYAMFNAVNRFASVNDDIPRFYFSMALVFISMALLVTHMDNLDKRIEQLPELVRNTTPTRGILAANNVLINGFLVFIITFGIASLFSPVVWRLISRGIIAASNYIRRLTARSPDEEAVGEESGEYLYEDEMDNERFTGDNGWQGEGWLTADHWIFTVGGIIVLIPLGVLILYGFYIIFKFFKKNFFNTTDGDEEDSLMPDDTLGKLKFMLGDLAAFLPRFKSDARHPIRRAFAKKVNRNIKKGVSIDLCDTPDVIADKIRPNEDIDALTKEYERVRYGRVR